MKQKPTLLLLVSFILLLCGVAVQAWTKDITLEHVTIQGMTINGVVDKPYVKLLIVDPATNQLIGQGETKADSKGGFSTQIVFTVPLQDDNTLALNVTDFDDYGNETISAYKIVLNCWTKSNSQTRPCDWAIHGPQLSDETMGRQW